MMQIANLKAEPDARGRSIVLSWDNPADPGFAGLKILRRVFEFPLVPDDIGTSAEIFDDPAALAGTHDSFRDVTNLRAGTTYYYAVVAQDALSRQFPAFVTALATSSFQTGDYLYRSLPEIYRTFDTFLPPPELRESLDEADRDKGQLRRFVEMFGLQFDLLRSFAGGLLDFQEIGRIDGNLIRLLAQWIGWNTDFTQSVPKQRNEVRFAPHFYRTLGIPANLRAMINRVSTWDALLKEFAHNIFRSNDGEQLTISEIKRGGGIWTHEGSTTLDVAHEGRASALLAAGGRPFLFYHAKEDAPESPSSPARARWHILYKAFEQDGWKGSNRLTSGDSVDRWPTAVQRSDGSIWIFWAGYEDSGNRLVPGLKLQVASVGRGALAARIQGSAVGPFAVVDGDQFRIVIKSGMDTTSRTVTLRAEDFSGISPVAADAMAAVLDRELPNVNVRAENGRIVLESQEKGAAVSLQVPASTVATTMGIAAPLTATGSDASDATLTGVMEEPFVLADQDQLTILQNGNPARAVIFQKGDFHPIGNAQAVEVASAINAVIPGAASVQGKRVVLHSNGAGEAALISVDVSASSAAGKLGFGVAPPLATGVDECEPSVIQDASNRLWLFWSSRRTGDWKIWFSRLDGNVWGAPKQLTDGPLADRECGTLFDATGGRVWVFWSRYKANGLWNVFFRNTLDVSIPTNPNWTSEDELQPVPPAPPSGYDNREPMPLLLGTDSLELYFASNRSNGWNSFAKAVSSGSQGADVQITTGQFTQRAPSPLKTGANEVRVFLRTNETQIYASRLYPSARTVDGRFAGSTTADTRNPARLSLRRNVQDIQHYTYHTPIHDSTLTSDQIVRLEEQRLYSRDTVGVYLVPDTNDELLITRSTKFMADVLRQFLPIQVRAVFLIDQAYTELVYDYQNSGQDAPLIDERMIDTILSEGLLPTTDSFTDTGGFKFIRTWAGNINPGTMPDLSVHPPELSMRMPVVGLGEET